MASLHLLFVCGMLAVAGAAHAQSTTPGGMPPPPGMSLAESAAMRFPQPVRVGDLLGRQVLRAVESQDVLGRVRRVVRDRNGQIMVVVDFGGFLGFGSRSIAVPVDAMVLARARHRFAARRGLGGEQSTPATREVPLTERRMVLYATWPKALKPG
jgi:hypothetical protein